MINNNNASLSCTTKKVIVVIVEGISDQVTFERYLNIICKTKTTVFSVCRGDILSNKDLEGEQYTDIINDLLKENARKNNYNLEDIELIVHLTDTDGVFCPDSVVEQGTDFLEGCSTSYSANKIFVKDVFKFLETRHLKLERICDCLSLNEIVVAQTKKVSYEIYYMSCNLECALYGIYNSTDEQKQDFSENFSKKFDDKKIDEFVNFMHSINKSESIEFKKSWDYIKQGNNSLKPCSNFIIFIIKLLSYK